MAFSRRIDSAANRGLERAYPYVRRGARTAVPLTLGALALLWRGLRPLLRWFFTALALIEAALRGLGRISVRVATLLSQALTPRRAVGLAIVAAGALLIVSQFLDYHGIQIGGQQYAGLPPGAAKAPTIELQKAGEAHSYVLVPVGGLVILCGLAVIARGGRLARLGAFLAIVAGAASLAVILLVDLPHGTDVGAQSSRFAGAVAVLEKGFAAELAAAGGVVLAGVVYYARPCLIRINLSGRAASARRRRPRRRASSPGRVARSA
jgi:hypothetical protein